MATTYTDEWYERNGYDKINGKWVKVDEKTFIFHPRTVEPEKTNKYYISNSKKNAKGEKGYNPCTTDLSNKDAYKNVMHNCVGYGWGRYHEILGDTKFTYCYPHKPPADWVYLREKYRNLCGSVPALGAIIFWRNGSSYENGHMAVVEQINYQNGSITSIGITEDEASGEKWNKRTITNSNGQWTLNESGKSTYYSRRGDKLLGFFYNPNNINSSNVIIGGDIINYDDGIPDNIRPDAIENWLENNTIITKDTTPKEYNDIIQRELAPQIDIQQTRGMDLFSSKTYIECPFITVQIGKYTFGSYNAQGTYAAGMTVTYPNYMDSITIVKVNGAVNQYTINMIYQIAPGDDPNLIDKVLSSVSDSRKIYISYGDYNQPSFIFDKEEAIITKVTSNIDFTNQKITYQLSCVSGALALSGNKIAFTAVHNKKGSDVIKELILNTSNGLVKKFPGMANRTKLELNEFIASDDREIDIEPKNTDVLTYLNYVVSCMSSVTNSNDSGIIKDSVYHLVIGDDVGHGEYGNEYGGTYFKVAKIGVNTKGLKSWDVYELDIGFPTNTLVTNFSINTDNSWSILYDYSNDKDIQNSMNNYTYHIDNDGILRSEYNMALTKNALYNKTLETDKTWWTKMTQFPITATLTIKGLLRPILLMNYIRINTYFYGQKHISTGVYAVTRQEDTINTSGYRTTLSLVRVAGDDDISANIVQTNTNVNSTADDAINSIKNASASEIEYTDTVQGKPIKGSGGGGNPNLMIAQ